MLDKKNSDIFHNSVLNIDCGYSLEPPRRGGSDKYPQTMFLSRNKKNNVYPCKPQFYHIKMGFERGDGGVQYHIPKCSPFSVISETAGINLDK